MPADPRRAKDLFAAALDLPPSERGAFLDRECDAELRARVEALLAAHDAPASALDRPLAQSATADYTPTETPGMVVAGRYKLLESIGEGGMGEVWVADQLEPIKRRVALKLIKPGMDSRSVLARFEAERQALALMDHPNIAKVLDAGTTEDGRPYFVMELVKGTPITTFCDARKLTPKERLELFVPVCQAIQHAHHKGIIHRDIKPTNVLVALHDEKPVPKVIDFGVAKAVGQQLTERTLYTGFGALVGTPAYMAPEQATFNQLDIDTRADVYALGVLLYELLAGSPPVEPERLKAAALDEVLRLVREEEPQRPSARLSTSQARASIAATRQSDPAKLSSLMRGELDWIVMKALEKDRTRRYDTANGLAKDVERYLKGDAVEACPPTLGYRLRKSYRRNRAAVVVATAFAVALLVGAAIATVGLVRAERARRGEAEQRQIAEAKTREAEVERAAAETARTKAMNALRATTDDVVKNLIGSREKHGLAERAYFEAALRRWQEFAAAEGDGELARSIRADGHLEVSRLHMSLGQRPEAAAQNRAALALYEQLAADFPDGGRYRHKLALAHMGLALRVRSLDRAEATRHEARGCELLRALTAEFPHIPEYWDSLADTSWTWVDTARDKADRRWRERERVAIYRRLTATHPAEPRYWAALERALENLAYAYSMEGDHNAELEHKRGRVVALERLTELEPRNPAHRRSLAQVHRSIWWTLLTSGDVPSAETHYQKALALRRDLAVEVGDAHGDRTDLESMQAWHDGRRPPAASLDRARAELAEAEKNAAEYPGIPSHQVVRVRVRLTLADALLDHDRNREACGHFERARTHTAAFSGQYSVFADQYLVRIDLGLGRAFTGFQDRPRAESHLRAAIGCAGRLVARHPADAYSRRVLGDTFGAYAKLHRAFGDYAAALPWHDKEIVELTKVRDQEPNRLGKFDFRNALWYRAQTLHALGRDADAIAEWDRIIKMCPPRETARARANRACCVAASGKVVEALAEIEAVLRSGDLETAWYSCAAVYAIASGKVLDRRREYGDRAMEYIRKWREEGWFGTDGIDRDADFDPIRDRDDFKQLVAELNRIAPHPSEKVR